MPEAPTTNVDAHMPPQPGDNSTVWADDWNPETDEWAPSNEQHAVFGVAEPSHGDEHNAHPMVNDPGDPRTYDDGGVTPDPRLNLLDAVRQGGPVAPPPQRVEHVITTEEKAAMLVRARVVRVQAGSVGINAAVTLIEENPNRRRALFKNITPSSQVLLAPIRQGSGGIVAAAVTASGNLAGYPLAPGDPVHEVKSGAGVEAYITDTGGSPFADIAVWEELTGTNPGLTGGL